ncbi:MAG: carboxypeptidase regulatory-like domain-containing protein, partial [Cyclobacteriaceae bacterium]|nr:carboxypeptidase regulatory-like domain-containing protein [Cyclobacteriaceae bacterium]
EADNFILNKDTSEIEIRLVAVPPPPGGNSDIEGIFVDEEGNGGGRITYGRYSGDGDPVEDAAVYLLSSNETIVDYDITDNLGKFSFQDLPIGNYQFLADYKGYPMDSENEDITIDENEQQLELFAVANNQLISARIESITGLHSLRQGGFNVFPVPVRDKLIVELPLSANGDQIDIYFINTLGKRLVVPQSAIQNFGTYIQLDAVVKDLVTGMYIIVLEFDSKGYFTKIIKDY